MYKGELISLTVAVSWTVCAMFAEVASKRLGSLPLNVIRMALSLTMLACLMAVYTGAPYPLYADAETWIWMSLSGFVGYVLGDYCLFNAYILIGSRFGQLLMTLAPPAAAIFGWMLLGEQMSALAICGMLITVAGIGLSVYKPEKGAHMQLPLKGILLGVGAGIGQGVGLVLSAKGLTCYEASLSAHGITDGAIITLIPFASTAMRAITGLIGFSIWTAARRELYQVREALTDWRGMLFALGATITGPFIGVSLSLMATLYTSTGIAQTIMAMTPILILWPSYLFFHQRITVREVIGAIISVAGVTLFFV